MKKSVKLHHSKTTGEKIKRVVLSIPLPLLNRLEREVAKQNVTTTKVILDCLDQQLPNLPGRPKTKLRRTSSSGVLKKSL